MVSKNVNLFLTTLYSNQPATPTSVKSLFVYANDSKVIVRPDKLYACILHVDDKNSSQKCNNLF